jgi:uncharacterized protein
MLRRLAALALLAPAAAAETTIANPAATFCAEEGGRFERGGRQGREHGICILPDGSELDAWEYFRERHSASPGALAGSAAPVR